MSQFERLLQVIRGIGAKTVGLQFPVGLRTKAVELAADLEEKGGVRVIISAEPSFGACDVIEMPADLVIHLGHAPIPHLEYRNVFFYDMPYEMPPLDFLESALPRLGRRVGLITTTQNRLWLPEIKKYLEDRGFEVRIGKPDRRVAYAGQVLGCDYHVATQIAGDVDTFLYVGTGDFHPLGVRIATDKPVIVADPERKEARDLEEIRDGILRQRWAAIVAGQRAQTFGIIVSTKPGQDRSGLAEHLRLTAHRSNRSAFIFSVNLVDPEQLEGYRVDAWVCTACPRIAIEDYLRFKKPILTPQEFEIALGLRRWEEYVFDEIRA